MHRARLISNKRIIAAVALMLMFSMTTVASLTYSSVTVQTSGVVVSNDGSTDVYAASGSAPDIQTAVNIAAAQGGGTVHVPAGNFTFSVNYSTLRVNNGYAGVQVPGGVNVIGAGNNQTVLYMPVGVGFTYHVGGAFFVLDGSNNRPIRISGLYFQVKINTTQGCDDNLGGVSGILEYGVKNYRIDNNTFIDNFGFGIYVSNNYIHNPEGNCGLIDHNIIDNPYKETFYNETGIFPYWAYGIGVAGDQQWRSVSELVGQYKRDTTYIEDNVFSRCRHCIAAEGSGSGGWYVARHNIFTDMILSYYGSYSDVHGGGRGGEWYDNTFIDCPTTYASIGNQPQFIGTYMGTGINPRGGAGIVFNNTFVNLNRGVLLSNDQSDPTYRLTNYWIWNNNYVNVTTELAISAGAFDIIQNVDYFLRAPNQAQDGFNYTPYVYPFPLSASGLPNPIS